MKVLVVNLKLKRVVIFPFLVYISVVLFVNFVSDDTILIGDRFIGNTYKGISHNYIPLTSIGTYLFNFQSYNFDTWFYNTFGNVLLFIPMGILLPILFAKQIRLLSTVVIIMLFSFTIETMQFITQLGVFNVDDIILNTIGGFLGYMILVLSKNMRRLYH
ncbi:VanZ family protein [Virgibacillus sp. SK37]|uniref:VanZ family protein n=1 Tax=Virgibacillus sp. SK37 TaxID=403957 RepID=UPI0004D1E02C|nr:VanZ family protein [Virgibacillus sp. SK37]AIF42160.1 teicoplanin resistance protein VanZ [Virgibacillus sp. SK37]